MQSNGPGRVADGSAGVSAWPQSATAQGSATGGRPIFEDLALLAGQFPVLLGRLAALQRADLRAQAMTVAQCLIVSATLFILFRNISETVDPFSRVEATVTRPSGGVVGARHTGRLLGNLLLNRGFIVETELQYALTRQADTGGPIGEILVDLGLITDRDLVELLAEQLRMHVVDLTRVDCDHAVLRLLTRDEAHRLAALPMRRVDGHIDVAIADPSDDNVVDELKKLLRAPLRLLLATRADIDAAVDRFYG